MAVIEAAAAEDEQIERHLCELWYTKGIAASALYRYAEAIDVLNRAAKREPQKPRYRDALAAAQLEAGNFEAALADLKVLEKLAPGTTCSIIARAKRSNAWERRRRLSSHTGKSFPRQDCLASGGRLRASHEALGGRDNLLLALSFLEQALQNNRALTGVVHAAGGLPQTGKPRRISPGTTVSIRS